MVEKIDLSAYMGKYDPRLEEVVAASHWYKWEYTEALIGADNQSEEAWLLAQGWKKYGQILWSGEIKIFGKTDTSKWIFKHFYKRRSLDAEKALNDLIKSYTAAYNDGKQINSERYDDIVSLYSLMLCRTEDELGAVTSEEKDEEYGKLVDDLIDEINASFAEHKSDMDGALDEYGDSHRARINLQFDNQKSAAKASMITRGTFNSTVWDTISAGVERERAFALSDLEDKILQQDIGIKERTMQMRVNIWGQILAARDRLRTQLYSDKHQGTVLRNNVLNALLNFMERRVDSYPDLANIGNLVTQLGAGSPGAFSP